MFNIIVITSALWMRDFSRSRQTCGLFFSSPSDHLTNLPLGRSGSGYMVRNVRFIRGPRSWYSFATWCYLKSINNVKTTLTTRQCSHWTKLKFASKDSGDAWCVLNNSNIRLHIVSCIFVQTDDKECSLTKQKRYVYIHNYNVDLVSAVIFLTQNDPLTVM